MYLPISTLSATLYGRPGPYRPRLPEEPGGDPHASYAYAAADASALKTGREEATHEVRGTGGGVKGTVGWQVQAG